MIYTEILSSPLAPRMRDRRPSMSISQLVQRVWPGKIPRVNNVYRALEPGEYGGEAEGCKRKKDDVRE